MDNVLMWYPDSLFSGMTSHDVIGQSIFRSYDMKKMLRGEANQNPLDST